MRKIRKTRRNGVRKKDKKKVRKMRRAEASGAIPARKHRRYCSSSCRRGAAQVYNRKRVQRSSEGANTQHNKDTAEQKPMKWLKSHPCLLLSAKICREK